VALFLSYYLSKKLTNMSNLQEKVNKEYPLYDITNSISKTDEYNGNEIQFIKRSAFQNGYEQCQKEYEEKQKWIKVKNDYFKQGLEEDILIKFKSSLNREVIVVGHIFQGRFYMNYSNDARPLKNVMSFRYFL
jgi:hypothetical protein